MKFRKWKKMIVMLVIATMFLQNVVAYASEGDPALAAETPAKEQTAAEEAPVAAEIPAPAETSSDAEETPPAPEETPAEEITTEKQTAAKAPSAEEEPPAVVETPVAVEAPAVTEEGTPVLAGTSAASEEGTPELAETPIAKTPEEVSDEAVEQDDDSGEKIALDDAYEESPEIEYAALEEFLKAVDEVGNVEEEEELLPALDNCLSVYNRLSPKDQETQAEAYAYIADYREQVAVGKLDEDISPLAANGQTTIYLYLNGTSLNVHKVIDSNVLGWAGKPLSWVVQTYFSDYYNSSDNYKYRNNTYSSWSGSKTSKINYDHKYVDINIVGTGNQGGGGGGPTVTTTLQVRTEVRLGSATGTLIAFNDGTAQTVTAGNGITVINYGTMPQYDTNRYGSTTFAMATRITGGYWGLRASTANETSAISTIRSYFPASGTNKVTVVYTVQWKNYTVTYRDGKNATLFSDQVYNNKHYGDATPVYTPAKSEYTDSAGKTWIFKGWEPTVKAMVDGNQTYTAQWEEKKNEYSDPIVDPGDGDIKGSFTVSKSFAGLPDDKKPNSVKLHYQVTYTKDGQVAYTGESGDITLTQANHFQYTLTPSVWRIKDDQGEYTSIPAGFPDTEKARYKTVIVITEYDGEGDVSGYTKSFTATYPADGTNITPNSVKFVLPVDTIKKTLSLKNTYTEQPNISVKKEPEKTEYTEGSDVSWNITVTNNGDNSVSGLNLEDVLKKDGASFTGTVIVAAPNGLNGTVDSFTLGSKNSVTFKATIEEAEAGTYSNYVAVKKGSEKLGEYTAEDVIVKPDTPSPTTTLRVLSKVN